MIANLMMYCRPELEGAHNRYWALIRHHFSEVGIDSPAHLSQEAEEFSVWEDPNLVLSQTCGMPYRTRLQGKVTLIGTPDFGLEDCPRGYYRSAIVVHKNEPRQDLRTYKDAVFAYNQTISQSGYAAPFNHLRPLGFWFENRLHSQQHILSAKAVATGQADIASLDAVTWRLICEYEDFANQLRVLEWTEPTPSLPYISAIGAEQEKVFGAVQKAIAQLSARDQKLLGLKGIIYIPAEEYLKVPNPDEVSS
mgnify:FL=1|jgi:ABC-type phosphate/phosphonate transport system substrate-binding protein